MQQEMKMKTTISLDSQSSRSSKDKRVPDNNRYKRRRNDERNFLYREKCKKTSQTITCDITSQICISLPKHVEDVPLSDMRRDLLLTNLQPQPPPWRRRAVVERRRILENEHAANEEIN